MNKINDKHEAAIFISNKFSYISTSIITTITFIAYSINLWINGYILIPLLLLGYLILLSFFFK